MELVNGNAGQRDGIVALSPAHGEAQRAEAADRRPLRIALFADSKLQPHWLVSAFEKVVASGVARIELVAYTDARASKVPWWWRLYSRVDAWCFGARADPATLVDLTTRVAAPRGFTIPDCHADLAALATWRASVSSLNLDVAFVLGDLDVRVVEGLAQHGVWRYAFGTRGDQAQGWAGIVETLNGEPVTACSLVARRGSGDERVVYRSWSRTHPYSVSRNRCNVVHKAAEFPLRALRALQCAHEATLHDKPMHPIVNDRHGTGRIGALPRLGVRIAQRALQKLCYVDQWFLAYRFGRGEGWSGDIRQYRQLMPPKDRIWADPFPIERNGRYFVFCEELPFAAGKGHIAMVELSPDGAHSSPVRVLERDYHLSYPFLIELHGALYMVPETLQNRSVELYRCVDFPLRWRLERVLMRNARYADATFHREGGTWWMFVNMGFEGAEAYDELHAFHADSLSGEWRPHAANPVKSDVRSARPAGRLFRRDGALYRPGQICAPLYGSGVSINRVVQLSARAYVEEEVERIVPAADSGILGVHTVNRAGELSVLDAFARRARL